MNDASRRLGDRYVIEGPLGAGGMGTLHRGRDERLGGSVAIKLLKRAHAFDEVQRERFRREAVALAKLRHPGIVTVLDFGESDGDLFTILELVEGGTLAELMENEGTMTVERVVPIVDQILAALEACHANDITHRDIKPSNVMVSDPSSPDVPHVKLIDFGLVRLRDATNDKLTSTGAVQGTAQYMAPEQCRGEEVGPPADVYAVGIVLYEMLWGLPPFRGADPATLMASHLFVEPTPLASLAEHVSAGLSAAVHSALAKNADDRPTARALRARLASAMKGDDPEARSAADADLRVHVSGLPREERALGTTKADPREESLEPVPVIAWMSPSDRAGALQSCLGAAGLRCDLAVGADVPTVAAGALVVVSARDGMARVRALRSTSPRVPVVVVDIDGPDETTEAIRAGASDMLLREAPDADLVAKLRRLGDRRGRR